MSHTYTLQLHTGSFVHQMHTFDEIKEKAERIIKKLKISDIILGWNTDEKLNQQLVSYFHEKGIRVLLWLPVLSETDQLKNITMITTVNGTQGERVNVIEHESFSFSCPGTQQNIDHVISIYEEYFSDIPFDGVFIDKIRFPSFANGYEEGFGCFCQSCQEKLTGVDLDEIKLLIHNHDHSLLAGQYDKEGIYHFDHQEVDAFYKQRANIITDYIIALTTYFSSRHLIVGADIYAPFLAYHVGQNTKKISEVVDFIKPMMYRYTEAPAGMRYEYQAYVQHFDDSKCFRDYWDDDPASDESIKKQLEFLSNLPTHVFPGIEINPIDGICSTDQSKLKQNFELFKDYSIISLCWDLMQMDETFLNIL